MPRGLVVTAVVVGAALRLYPLGAPYVHPDQEAVPVQALGTLAAGTWRPPDLVYPSGFLFLLRAGDAAALWWRVHVTGAARDAIDLLVAYLEDPSPFLLVARAWACAFGIATVVLAGALGRRVGGAWAGAAAALLVAVSPLHVRESHYGTGDVPATALLTASLVAATAFVRAPRSRTLVAAGALAGLAAAFRYPAALALGGVVAAAAVAPLPWGRRARLACIAVVAGCVAFFVVTPYTVLELERARVRLGQQLAWSRLPIGPQGLPLATLLAAANGSVVCGLAAVGAVALAIERRRELVPLLATALPALLALSRTTRVFARYTLPLVPIVAVLAASALAAIGARRRGRGVAIVLLVAAIASPALRSVAIVRLLAREDTRVAAGAYLRRTASPAVPVWVPTAYPGYANPLLPLTAGAIAWRLDPDVVQRLAARTKARDLALPVAAYRDGVPEGLAPIAERGGLVVTVASPHPALEHWASTAPATTDFLRAHGTPVATFTGVPDAVPADTVLFEPIDASFVPLVGAERLAAPGPTITVWRVPAS